MELPSLILKSLMENGVLHIKFVVEGGCTMSVSEPGRPAWYLVRQQL